MQSIGTVADARAQPQPFQTLPLLASGLALLVIGAGLGITDNLGSVALVILGSVLIAFSNTIFTLHLTVFLVSWQIYLANWPDSTYTFRLIDILISSVVVVTLLKAPRAWRQFRSGWILPLWIFFGLAIVSGLARGQSYAVGKFVVDWWPSLAFYWLLLVWGAKLNWPKLIRVLQLSFVLQAVLGLAQTAIGNPAVIISFLRSPTATLLFDRDLLAARIYDESFNFIWRGRVFAFGTYLGSSGLGIVLAVAGAVTWALVLKSKRLLASWNFYLAIALSGTCLLVMKRSGWISLASGLFMVIVLGYWLRKLSGRNFLVILVLAGMLAGGFAYWQRDPLLDRINDQVGWQYGRDQTWPAYLNLAARQPFFGYGPGYPQGSQAIGLPGDVDYALGPENTYLHLALTAGALGLLAFLWLIVHAAEQVWRARRSQDKSIVIAVLSGLAAMGLGGMFVISLGDLQNGGALFFLLALAHHCALTYRQELARGRT